MLDVHAPHIKLHGFGEFLTHLLTITVGLLIATQIESCVEWRHHVHLAQEARASLRLEIEHNLSDLKEARTGLKLWRKQVRADLLAMQRIQDLAEHDIARPFEDLVIEAAVRIPLRLAVAGSGCCLDRCHGSVEPVGALGRHVGGAERAGFCFQQDAHVV